MSFARKHQRVRPKTLLPGAALSRGLLIRTVIVGLFAIGGAAWALDRHYTHGLPPMRVPVAPRETPTFDADAGEFPVPDFFTVESGTP
jgi:hypothetical protein